MPRLPALAILVLPLLLVPLGGCGNEPPLADRTSPAEEVASPSRAELSTTFRTALGAGEVEEAAAALDALAHAGDGSLLVGEHTLSAEVARATLLDACLAAARERIEAFPPDRPGALHAIDVALEVATPEDAERVEGTRLWVSATDASGLPGPLAEHEGPRVVFYVDDFHLGEALLQSVGARWAREGEKGMLRVSVLPILRGKLRGGTRRIHAERGAEIAGLARDVARIGLELEPGVLTGRDAQAKLGLGKIEGALVILDRHGRIVGRMTGAILDPRPLNTRVEKVTSR